jgi:hypothetical protein
VRPIHFGKQILLDDPSGNPVELFEPTLSEASIQRLIDYRAGRCYLRDFAGHTR